MIQGETTSDAVPPEAIGGVLSSLWTKSKAMNLLSRGRVKSNKIPYSVDDISLNNPFFDGHALAFYSFVS